MCVDSCGRSLDGKKPSAETLLHMAIYLVDYELLKVFPGVEAHEVTVAMRRDRDTILQTSQDACQCAGNAAFSHSEIVVAKATR